MIRGKVRSTECDHERRDTCWATIVVDTDRRIHELFHREVVIATQPELDALVAEWKAHARRWENRVIELESRMRTIREVAR